MLEHPDFAGLHFTGSTFVFQALWQKVAVRISKYRSFPRLVGETGGKNMHFVHASADVESAVNNTVRGAFEYQGQKCSACSRLYVPDVLWCEFKKRLVEETKRIKMGPVTELDVFCGPVINQAAFDNIKGYIEFCKGSAEAEIIAGGACDQSRGWFIEPTIVVTRNLQFKTIQEEIFGPVLTVFVYPSAEYEKYLELAAGTSPYALTAAVFARDCGAVQLARDRLRHAAGNLYVNDKCTGAVVGQQPFGGARHSGTNDKAGSRLNLLRWVSPQTIKENFVPLGSWRYASNDAD